MTPPKSKVTFKHVHISRGVVDAYVETNAGKVHRIGHLPFKHWFCVQDGNRCGQIGSVKELVPVNLLELGAERVEAGGLVERPIPVETRLKAAEERAAYTLAEIRGVEHG